MSKAVLKSHLLLCLRVSGIADRRSHNKEIAALLARELPALQGILARINQLANGLH